MHLPKFHETFIPILDVLKDGETIPVAEFRKRVHSTHYANLPKELMEERTKSGQNLFFDRVNWAKSYLKIAGYLESPQRGSVRISEKGRAALAKGNLTLDEVRNDPQFQEYHANGPATKTSKPSTSSNKPASTLAPIPDTESSSPQDKIDAGITEIEQQVKTELLSKLRTIDPYYFQTVVLQLLNRMGYGDFIETPKSGDGGIDGIINQDKLGVEKIYLQVKRFNGNKVRELDIRNFIGAMSGDTTKGVFVTTSTFHPTAIRKAHTAHHTIILVDGNKLVDLMYEYGIGVQVRNRYEVKAVDEDFFEEG